MSQTEMMPEFSAASKLAESTRWLWRSQLPYILFSPPRAPCHTEAVLRNTDCAPKYSWRARSYPRVLSHSLNSKKSSYIKNPEDTRAMLS